VPSYKPTIVPSKTPNYIPTQAPTTKQPSFVSSLLPTISKIPSHVPSLVPTTIKPTAAPTDTFTKMPLSPTFVPSLAPLSPSFVPTYEPTDNRGGASETNPQNSNIYIGIGIAVGGFLICLALFAMIAYFYAYNKARQGSMRLKRWVSNSGEEADVEVVDWMAKRVRALTINRESTGGAQSDLKINEFESKNNFEFNDIHDELTNSHGKGSPSLKISKKLSLTDAALAPQRSSSSTESKENGRDTNGSKDSPTKDSGLTTEANPYANSDKLRTGSNGISTRAINSNQS
jgi:hypothetical protein